MIGLKATISHIKSNNRSRRHFQNPLQKNIHFSLLTQFIPS